MLILFAGVDELFPAQQDKSKANKSKVVKSKTLFSASEDNKKHKQPKTGLDLVPAQVKRKMMIPPQFLKKKRKQAEAIYQATRCAT